MDADNSDCLFSGRAGICTIWDFLVDILKEVFFILITVFIWLFLYSLWFLLGVTLILVRHKNRDVPEIESQSYSTLDRDHALGSLKECRVEWNWRRRMREVDAREAAEAAAKLEALRAEGAVDDEETPCLERSTDSYQRDLEHQPVVCTEAMDPTLQEEDAEPKFQPEFWRRFFDSLCGLFIMLEDEDSEN